MKASDYIAETLESRGVTDVFELVGGMITHMLDSFAQRTNIRVVSVHHEQAAAFAAEGYARIRGTPGVALGTSGPGATNLLTGIGSCYFDSIPAVFITGQVNRNERKLDRKIRQLGFQETDIVAMARPITKWAVTVEDPETLPEILDRAFETAMEGRPGPVLIDIPMDVQRAEIEPPAAIPAKPRTGPKPDEVFMQGLFRAIRGASRPLILAGGGIRSGQAAAAFRQFVEALNVPVVHSLLGVDLLPFDSPARVGMIGSYGNRWANAALAESDLLLVLGSRLDIRQTGSRTDLFGAGRTIYHVDCDAGEMNNRVTGCETLVARVDTFLNDAIDRLRGETPGSPPQAWLDRIATLKRQYPDTAELKDAAGINPNVLMHTISKAAASSAAFVVDVGQHQMWAAQSLELNASQRFLTSGGMGAMGFALPAAIGAWYGAPCRCVTVIAGDGGFQLNVQELQTIARNCLPLKMIVLNNQCHGMVRQFQASYFESRFQSTVTGYSAPDFRKVATAYGIAAARVEAERDIHEALRQLYADPAAPFLLEVMIDRDTNVYPKMAFGRSMDEMEPEFQSLDQEGT